MLIDTVLIYTIHPTLVQSLRFIVLRSRLGKPKKKKKNGLTSFLNIPHSCNQSISTATARELDVYMGFAQSVGLTSYHWFRSQTQMSIPPLFGLCHREEKNRPHWSLCSVSRWRPLQLATTIWNTGHVCRAEMLRQAIHGWVHHLSATVNSFWRHIITDLWPLLRAPAPHHYTTTSNIQH